MKISVDRIFYINLDRSVIRKKELTYHFKKIGLVDKDGREPIRVPAINGNNITHSVVNKKDTEQPGRPLSMGELGCHASHRAILQMQIENEWPYVMYLEDDVRFVEKNMKVLIQNWDKLPEFDFFNLSWKYFNKPKQQKLESVEFPLKGLEKGDGMWLTHCYILSLYGARKCEELTRIQSHSVDWHYAQIQSHIPSIGYKYGILSTQNNKGSGMKSIIVHT